MDIRKSKKEVKNIDYEAIFKEYMTTDKPLKEIAKKFGLSNISDEKLELMVKEFAEKLDAAGYKSPDKKTFLSKFYEKRRKRKEKIQKENKKKQDEENEKLRKEQDEKEKEEKLEKAKTVLKAYTSFDGDIYEFLNTSKMSKKYFDNMYYTLVDDNSKDSNKLYREVKSKLYEDYINDKNSPTEKIDEEEFKQKVLEAKYIANSYINASDDKLKFCRNINISKKYFDDTVYTLKYEDYKLYEQVILKTANDRIKESVLIPKLIKKVSEKISDGIQEEVGKRRNFNILDYYKTTDIEIEKLKVLADNYNMDKELILINEFIESNKLEIKELNFENKLKKTKDEKDKEYLLNVKEYMKNNKIPLLEGTFELVVKKFNKDNDIKKAEEEKENKENKENEIKTLKPVDELIIKELSQNEGSEDLINTFKNILYIKNEELEKYKI